ncbi:MAG: hypothetical protein Q7S09_05245 [bacterium]|nr:hypothetical protein [bacterium]
MQQIIERLKNQNALSEIIEKRLREFWKYCVEEIRDVAIRESVELYLQKTAPWQFFSAPASPSGKHHPIWQNDPGGILRNTVECCLSIDMLMTQEWQLGDADGIPHEPARSIIYAATIVSDTCKGGNPWGPKTDRNHGRIAAELWKTAAGNLAIPQNAQELIYEAVYWHLGRWTPGWTEEIDASLSLHTKITHALDALYADKNLEKIFIPRPLPM